MDPKHPKHDFLYELHSNESIDTDCILFNSLGHWRMAPGFHDILWNPACYGSPPASKTERSSFLA